MSFSNTSVGDKPADPYKKANEDDVDVKTKITDLSNFMTACKFGMMTTHEAASDHIVSRCMALAATEMGGVDLLLFTNTESGKTNDISKDPHVNLAFLNVFGEWASVAGQASIVTDRDLVKKHYSPDLKAWVGDLGDGKHDGSANDPRIAMIRIRTHTATYALVAKNFISRAAEVVQGAVTGKPAHTNKLREISASEIQDWRSIHT